MGSTALPFVEPRGKAERDGEQRYPGREDQGPHPKHDVARRAESTTTSEADNRLPAVSHTVTGTRTEICPFRVVVNYGQ